VALQLRKHGIRHVRPLLGGFHEWKQLGFPLVELPDAPDPMAQTNHPIAEGA
jgi:hypothetical protein